MAKKIKAVKKAAVAKKPAKKIPAKAAAKKVVKKVAVKKAPAKVVKPVKVAPKPKVVKPKKPVLLTPKNDASKQYTQAEFYDSLVGYCGFPKRKEAKEFYVAFCGLIQESLKAGYKLLLPGLGKLQVKKSAARMGINPATREPIQIAAKKRVRFTPAKVLKEAVL